MMGDYRICAGASQGLIRRYSRFLLSYMVSAMSSMPAVTP